MSIAPFMKPCFGEFLGSVCLAASLLIFSPHTAAQSPSTATGTADFSSLGEWISLQEDLLKHLDRTFIELDAALDANDFDADSLVDFVRREIGFQQYPGVVRGAL